MNELIDQILQNANLTQACFEVIRNKGAGGVFQFLGFGFVPIYKKGVKGKYQLVITKKSGINSKVT